MTSSLAKSKQTIGAHF